MQIGRSKVTQLDKKFLKLLNILGTLLRTLVFVFLEICELERINDLFLPPVRQYEDPSWLQHIDQITVQLDQLELIDHGTMLSDRYF